VKISIIFYSFALLVGFYVYQPLESDNIDFDSTYTNDYVIEEPSKLNDKDDVIINIDDLISPCGEGVWGCWNAFVNVDGSPNTTCNTSCMNCGPETGGVGYDLTCKIKCDGSPEDAFISCGKASEPGMGFNMIDDCEIGYFTVNHI